MTAHLLTDPEMAVSFYIEDNNRVGFAIVDWNSLNVVMRNSAGIEGTDVEIWGLVEELANNDGNRHVFCS